MRYFSPKAILAIGFVLVFLGALLPWLMVMHLLESTFFLNFFAFGSTIAGMILGFLGVVSYVAEHRGRDQK
jgi:hypothetical protein